MKGTVRSLTDYGAFVDIGGVDGLLHVGDISWSRINKPSDVLTIVDAETPTSSATRAAMTGWTSSSKA